MADLTWRQLNDSLQSSWLAGNPNAHEGDTFYSQFEASTGDEKDHWLNTEFQIPGYDGYYTRKTDSTGNPYFAGTTYGQRYGNIGQYQDVGQDEIRADANGNIVSKHIRTDQADHSRQPDVGWADKYMPGIIIAAIGAMVGGAAAGQLGAGAGEAAGGAGWVSAEGGAGYAGGLAADSSALAGAGEVAGWVSAEGGTGYANGLAVDATVPGFGSTLLNKAGALVVDKATAWGLAQAGGAITAGVDRATSETRSQANPGGGYGGGPGVGPATGSQPTPTNQQGKLVAGGIMIATALMMLAISKAGA